MIADSDDSNSATDQLMDEQLALQARLQAVSGGRRALLGQLKLRGHRRKEENTPI